MAKESMKARERKREALVAKYAAKIQNNFELWTLNCEFHQFANSTHKLMTHHLLCELIESFFDEFREKL